MLSILVALRKYLRIIIFFLLICCQQKKTNDLKVINGYALGTSYSVTYLSKSLETYILTTHIDSIFTIINKSMSTYEVDSDISKINRGDSLLQVDVHFQNVYNASSIIWKKTDGYFDPTVGALVNAYGFGPEKKIKSISKSERDEILKYTGWNKTSLTMNNTIQKKDPNIYLDFNALAKGYTVDQINLYFEKAGSKNHLIDIGGELISRGKNLETKKLWSVGIEKPSESTLPRKIFDIIELNNQALATSGNYRKYRIDKETKQKYVHSINPLNGRPARSNILSVSVKALDCMTADAYATALMVMPLNMGKKLINKTPDVDALWIISESQNFVSHSSKNW